MKFSDPVHLLFLALVAINVSEAFKPKELELTPNPERVIEVEVEVDVGVTTGLDSPDYVDVFRFCQHVHAESGAVMHDDLNLSEYADYLSREPQTAPMPRLSKDKERALLRGAYQRKQELCEKNEDESVILGDIDRAVCVIIKAISFPLVDYNQAPMETRVLMAAQGMEQAIMTLKEISTTPDWLRLGFMAFITMDDFPTIHKLLSEHFKASHYLDMLHASALTGNIKALDYLSTCGRCKEKELLWTLMKYGCYGGHQDVFQWTSWHLWVGPSIKASQALKWAAEAGQSELFQSLAVDYPMVYTSIRETLASSAIENGKLAILKYVSSPASGFTGAVGDRVLDWGIRKAATNGNITMLQYLIKLHRRENLGYPELTQALQNVVAIGSQKGLEFLLGLPWFIDSLYQKSPEWPSILYLLAAKKGHLHIVRFFLAEEIDGTRRFPNLSPAYRAEFSRDQDFITHGADNVHNRPSIDAVMLAARWGHSKIVEYLLVQKESGKQAFQQIDPTAGNYFALRQAILSKHELVVDMLFKFVDAKVISSRIFEACGYSGNVKILKSLAEMGMFTEASSELPITLSQACSQGSLDVVKYILEDLLKFNLTLVVEDMEMNLLSALEAGKDDIVQYLLQKKLDGSLLFQGIDLSACSNTLFERAVYNRYEPMVNFLLSNVREHIDIRIIDAIPSSYYKAPSILRVIIRERYGPCPYSVGSVLEESWFKWKALWHYGLM